jgi:hypothetical protein
MLTAEGSRIFPSLNYGSHVSDLAKWLIVLFGIVVFGVVGLTAMDKYDERSCRDHPRIVKEATYRPAEEGENAQIVTGQPEPVIEVSPAVRETCDGFLPW